MNVAQRDALLAAQANLYQERDALIAQAQALEAQAAQKRIRASELATEAARLTEGIG